MAHFYIDPNGERGLRELAQIVQFARGALGKAFQKEQFSCSEREYARIWASLSGLVGSLATFKADKVREKEPKGRRLERERGRESSLL